MCTATGSRPAVAARLDEFVAGGGLRVAAGALLAAARDPEGDGTVSVRWRARGTGHTQTLTAVRVINCTGPAGDIARGGQPLLAALVARGVARADPHRLGLDIDAQARLVGADGAASPHLYAVGPITRGAIWEITAVPDIRRQVWDLARTLSAAHWVGGEGL